MFEILKISTDYCNVCVLIQTSLRLLFRFVKILSYPHKLTIYVYIYIHTHEFNLIPTNPRSTRYQQIYEKSI